MLASTTDELMLRFRSDVDDKITDVDGSDIDCLWKNEDVYAYMTVACDRVAKDTDNLPKVMRLPVKAGEAGVRVPAYVTDIRSARLVNRNCSLDQVNTNSTGFGTRSDYGIQHNGFLLMFDSSGTPNVFVRDYDRKEIRLVPVPVEDDTLEIQCNTAPSLPQEQGMPLPFTDTEDQMLVLYWMKAQAYRKHDAETEDLVRAKENEALYDHWSVERKYELQRQRRSPPVLRMNW